MIEFKYLCDVVKEDEKTVELCPHCGSEVLIPIYKASPCPECGEFILPCSACDRSKDCSECPYFYIRVKCLNCGNEFETDCYKTDELGNHVICPECKSSFDIDAETEGN